ncbi:hypothetical protein K439DRAFT_1378447 [Ramaria rubella]|nr:hypothetical protein K439DRAFT_1378447 [Ramaria rubella]
MLLLRQLRIAINTVYLQRVAPPYPSQGHVHPVKVRAFASTPRTDATESPSFKESPLFQQLATNKDALLAVQEFANTMKERGIDFSPERRPTSMQLLRLLANPEFRKSVQKLRDDLEKAGVNVNPEDAMEMLNAFRGQDAKPK